MKNKLSLDICIKTERCTCSPNIAHIPTLGLTVEWVGPFDAKSHWKNSNIWGGKRRGRNKPGILCAREIDGIQQSIQNRTSAGSTYSPPGTRRCWDVESTSTTLILRLNNAVCPVGALTKDSNYQAPVHPSQGSCHHRHGSISPNEASVSFQESISSVAFQRENVFTSVVVACWERGI